MCTVNPLKKLDALWTRSIDFRGGLVLVGVACVFFLRYPVVFLGLLLVALGYCIYRIVSEREAKP